MSWRDTSTDDYILFLCEWRSRQEIKDNFKLSNVSSWHCVKFLSKLNSIQKVVGLGKTGKMMKYKARAFAIEEALNNKNEAHKDNQ